MAYSFEASEAEEELLAQALYVDDGDDQVKDFFISFFIQMNEMLMLM
jgi:hypothetical protein